MLEQEARISGFRSEVLKSQELQAATFMRDTGGGPLAGLGAALPLASGLGGLPGLESATPTTAPGVRHALQSGCRATSKKSEARSGTPPRPRPGRAALHPPSAALLTLTPCLPHFFSCNH